MPNPKGNKKPAGDAGVCSESSSSGRCKTCLVAFNRLSLLWDGMSQMVPLEPVF